MSVGKRSSCILLQAFMPSSDRRTLSLRITIPCVILSLVPLAVLLHYVASHAVNLPWGEGFRCVSMVVLPAHDGTLAIPTLFTQYSDHRPIITLALMAANTLLTHCDIRVQTFTAVAEMAMVLVCCALAFRADRPRWAPIALVPFSMLLFSINLRPIWIRQYNDFQFSFVSLGLLAIRTWQPRWRTLAFAALMALLSLCGTLTGIMAWFAFPLSMYLMGYRRVRYYVVWAGLLALTALVFFRGYAISEDANFHVRLSDITLFVLGMLGSGLSRQPPIAIAATLVGGAMTAANLLYLKSRPRFSFCSSFWLGVIVFTVLASVITAVGRSWHGPDQAVVVLHYARHSVYLWTAIVAFALLTLTDDRPAGPILKWANVCMLVVAAALYLRVNVLAYSTWVTLGDGPLGPTTADEQCAWRSVIMGDTTCMHWDYWFDPSLAPTLYALAERRLTTFAHSSDAIMKMPSDYRRGDLVIVDAPLAVQHLPVVDPRGDPIPSDDLFRLILPSQKPMLTVAGGSIVDADQSDVSALAATMRNRRVWVVRAVTHTPLGDAAAAHLGERRAASEPPPRSSLSYPEVTIYIPTDRRDEMPGT